jgi:tetraprenyl-beta-curcumene synthase
MADPRTTRADATKIDAAYHPSISALSVLLDSLVDYRRDAATTNYSFIRNYPSSAVAAERIAAIAADAQAAARELPNGSHHAVIVAGLAAFYLSAREAWTPAARPVTLRVLNRLGPIAWLCLAVVWLIRRLRGRHSASAVAATARVGSTTRRRPGRPPVLARVTRKRSTSAGRR